MANNDLKPDIQNDAFSPFLANWPWYLAVVLVVGAVEPLVGAVRQESEPYVGHWFAYSLGILAAAAAALPIFAVVSWVIRSEQSKQSNSIAPMIYRPAALPSLAFIGAILKNFPAAFTEIATYGFLGSFVLLLVVAVFIQKRKLQAWSWVIALPIGFGIALLALMAAGLLSIVSGHRP